MANLKTFGKPQENHLLTQDCVLRLLPALTIPRADLDAFADALEDILSARTSA